ncbi:hypothetical protein LOZ53_005858 [Ophidiomyces ophidiicola]|nr:hypothetical protein LOZ53_005858 [Ophidiomyces ophidiicola]
MTLDRTDSHRSRRSRRSRSQSVSRSQSSIRRTRTNQSINGKETPDHLHGHLNHLTPPQARALDEFKAACLEKNLYSPAADEGRAASHDDPTLLRFLRARKFDVNGALQQFQTTEDWRKTNQIDALYENFDVDSYDEARRVYPQWTGRRDRRGIPIYVFVIKHLNSKSMAAYSSGTATNVTSSTHTSSTVPPRLLRLFALYENMTRFVVPLCSSLPRPNPETPISSTTNIVDVSGVGLKQFWNLKGHMQDASVLATAHYPETLDRIYVIGAPYFFPTVWGWIKRWFDPVTTSKIYILSASEVKTTLTMFMEPSSIPKRFGGELDWEWEDMPNLDEPARELVGTLENLGPTADGELTTTNIEKETSKTEEERKKNFTKGPIAWVKDRIEIFGSIGGKTRRKTVHVEQKQQLNDKPALDSNHNTEETTSSASTLSTPITPVLVPEVEKLALSPAQSHTTTAVPV